MTATSTFTQLLNSDQHEDDDDDDDDDDDNVKLHVLGCRLIY